MKTTSTGFEKSKIHTYLSLFRYFNRNEDFAKNDYYGYLRTKQLVSTLLGPSLSDKRILEIGCGQRFARTLLFHTEGAVITGIDLDVASPRFTCSHMLNILKHNGFERLAKTVVRHLLYDKKYYSTIECELGRPLKYQELDIRTMSACNLDFPEDNFDFIFSNAVFEHIEDVEKAWCEVSRVLKQTGYASIEIHLFPSLSGGHNFEWAYPDKNPSKIVPPWDHLRENKFPTHAYLNKLTKSKHKEIATRYFDICDETTTREGESLLSAELRSSIRNYSEDDLLTRTITLLVQKKPRLK